MGPFILIRALPFAGGILLLAITGGNARWRTARNVAGFFLVGVPVGGLAYLFSGIWIARARGVGHFFSMPFGGLMVTDNAIFGSLVGWVGLVFSLLVVVFYRRFKRSP